MRFERQLVLLARRDHAHHDLAVHRDEPAVASHANRALPERWASAPTVASLSPRFRIVSIIPGIEAGAPDAR